MSEETVIAVWKKNSREYLMVRLDNYKGQAVIDCRAWYEGSDGGMKPGRGGLTVSTRHLPALADSIAKAMAFATASGLIAGNDPRND